MCGCALRTWDARELVNGEKTEKDSEPACQVVNASTKGRLAHLRVQNDTINLMCMPCPCDLVASIVRDIDQFFESVSMIEASKTDNGRSRNSGQGQGKIAGRSMAPGKD